MVRLVMAFIMSMAFISGAHCIKTGGGEGALTGAESTAEGSFPADGTGAASMMSSKGTIYGLRKLRFVRDSLGKLEV